MFWMIVSVVSLVVLYGWIVNRFSPHPVWEYLGHLVPALPCAWATIWFGVKRVTASEEVYRDIPWAYLTIGAILWSAVTITMIALLSTQAGREWLGTKVGEYGGRLARFWGYDSLPGICLCVFAVVALVTFGIQGLPRFREGFIGQDLEELQAKVSGSESAASAREVANTLFGGGIDRALGRAPRPEVTRLEVVTPLPRYPRTWFWFWAAILAVLASPVVVLLNSRDNIIDAFAGVAEKLGFIKSPRSESAVAEVAAEKDGGKEGKEGKGKEKETPKPTSPPAPVAAFAAERQGITYWFSHVLANLFSDTVVERWMGKRKA
ncbi:MAG: hypothetical protein PHI63_02710 [Patescibacteria group bacterium]|nr:hypothetical protein [Patescibacteria group bacterium]